MKNLRVSFLTALSAFSLILAAAARADVAAMPDLVATAVSDATARRAPVVIAASALPQRSHARTATKIAGAQLPVSLFDPVQADDHLVLSNGFDNRDGSCDQRAWMFDDRSDNVYAHVSNRFVVNRPFLNRGGSDEGAAFPVNFPAPLSTTNLQLLGPVTPVDSGNVALIAGPDTHPHLAYPSGNVIRSFGSAPNFRDMKFDPSTQRLIATEGSRIFAYPKGGGIPFVIAGDGSSPSPDSTALQTGIDPDNIAVDNAGNIYWGEVTTHTIRMLRKNDQRVVTIGGIGIGGGHEGDGGPALSAMFNRPGSVAVDPAGTTLYILDTEGGEAHPVRRIDLATGIVNLETTIPGSFFDVGHLTYSGGTLYFLELSEQGHVAHKIVAGTPQRITGFPTNTALSDQYNAPATESSALATPVHCGDLEADGAGGLYIPDPDARLIFRFHPAGTLEKVAGVASGAIVMEQRALWFGADSNSAPEEVGRWVSEYGFGNGWSQRLTSPNFSLATHPNAVLSFEGTVTLLGAGTNAFLCVRAELPDGSWTKLHYRMVESQAALLPSQSAERIQDSGWFKLEVHLGADGNESLGLLGTTRLQIVVQTPITDTMEDGSNPATPGAAIIDNVALRDGAAIVLPAVDFEDGSTGDWTLSALNGAYDLAYGGLPFERDGAPNTIIDLRTGYDFADNDCVWTFASPGDTVSPYVWSRLESPWIPRIDPNGVLIIEFSGKLNTEAQRRVLDVLVLGKNAGQARPHVFARPNFLLNSGGPGGDLQAPYLTDQELLYPLDYDSFTGMDSVKVLFQIEGRRESLVPVFAANDLPTRLPYLDDLELYELGVDAADYDGIPDVRDLCPGVFAAGEDADADGCISPTASMRHIESWATASLPIKFQLAANGDPDLPGDLELAQIRQSFQAWDAVSEANLSFIERPTVASGNADALDGINLVTFEDDHDFAANVIALTTTTSFTRTAGFWDEVAIPGQIVEADIIFNSDFTFDIGPGPLPPGAKDLRSTATHEIGHLLGLSHSGVRDATMYPILLGSRDAASLEDDDREAVSAAFPTAALTTSFATLRGSVRKGTDNAVVPGALVMAVRLSGNGAPEDTVASDFTREDGSYALFRLPAASYGIRIAPLDGSVPGLLPKAVNERVLESAFTSFAAEWYGGPESNADDPNAITPIAVTAGVTLFHDVITNIDVTPPTILSVAPSTGQDSVRIQSPVVVHFSEPVAAGTLANAFKLRKAGAGGTVGGLGNLVPPGDVFVFSPTSPLAFGETYEIAVTTDLTDRDGNALLAPFSSTFLTEIQPTVAILDIQPRQAPEDAFITITGVGFNPADIEVVFPGGAPGDFVTAVSSSPTAVVVQVPGYAVDGPVVVVSDNETSNAFDFDVIVNGDFQIPNQLGEPIALNFAPTDVALTPEGSTAIAVGNTGVAIINLSPGRPHFRDPQYTSLPGARRIALTPDGRRALVTVPSGGKVSIIDTDTSSATFGLVRKEVTGLTSPDAVTTDQSGERAWVTQQGGPQIFELNIDVLDAGYPTMTRTDTTAFTLNGGLTLIPQQSHLFATSASGIVQVSVADGSSSLLDSGIGFVSPATANAIEMIPGGDRLVACGAGTAANEFVSVEGGTYVGGSAFTYQLLLGGTVRDVLVEPFGANALVANSTLDLVQIVDIAGNALVGQAVTPGNPVALALTADGSLLAVATAGDPGVTFYSTTSSTQITNISPTAARAGDQVVMRVAGTLLAPSRFQGPSSAAGGGAGTRTPIGVLFNGDVVVGGTTTPVTYSQNFTTAFTVPDLTQQETSVSFQGAGSTSGAVSFTVVDPIEPLVVRNTGAGVTTAGRSCVPGSPPARMLAISPNGRFMAVSSQSPCGMGVDIYDISGSGAGTFGRYIGSTSVDVGGLTGLAFSATSDNLYLTSSDTFDGTGEIKRFRFGGSPDSAQILGTQRLAVAVDPATEFIAVLQPGGDVQIMNSNLGLIVPLFVANARSLAWTRDGHYLVVGTAGAITLIDRGPLVITNSTSPPRAGAGTIEKLALTSDGRRVVGLYSSGAVGMWSLEAGTLAAETFHGIPPLSSPSSMVPAPDGNAILIGSSTDAGVAKLETIPPGFVLTAPFPGPTQYLATTPDGRQLWVADQTSPVARLATMSLATTLSVIAGNDLSAETGAELPIPVTVQLTDAAGTPQAGVLVRFQISATEGYLDGVPSRLIAERLTDASGEASVRWTMPASPGALTMEVTAPAVAGPLVVNATATGDASVAAPLVVGLGPVDGATGIRSDGSMYVKFSQRMSLPSVGAGLSLTAGIVPVGGVTEREDDYTFRFNPTNPLTFSASCTFRVNSGIADLEGQTLAAASETHFTVEPEPILSLELITPPAAPTDASIVLSGNGFSPIPAQNSVLVGGQLAAVSTATPTALVVTVPKNAVSGDVTVQIGANTSNPLSFVVLDPDAEVGGVLGDLTASKGIRDIAVTSDGTRTYVTNPGANSVAALDVENATTLAVIPVGLTPQAIVILPGDKRAYVANTGSDNVSVLDIDPQSTAYHTSIPSVPGVVRPIPVGDQPVELAVAPFTEKVVVVCAGDSTVHVIDTDPTSPAADQVVATIPISGGGSDVVVEPEGHLAYVATENGVEIVNITSGTVVTTIPISGGGTDVAIEPDGALLFVLTGNDSLYVIDITPGSDTENRVVASVPIGGGGSDVDVQPDGTHVWVTIGDGDEILVFEIVHADEAGASVVPGPLVVLELVASIDVGNSPAAIAFAPITGLCLVANEGDGTITLIGPPNALGDLEFAMDFSPNTINLKSIGRYVQGCVGPLDPYTPADVLMSTVRLNGVVPAANPAGASCAPGVLQAKFDRAAAMLTLGNEETAIVTVTGQVGTRLFVARDTITVKVGKVIHPHAGDHVTAGSPFTILYDRKSTTSTRVAIVHSVDDGRTWTIFATDLPNDGAAPWIPPLVMTDSARVAIVEIEEDLGNDEVIGVLGVSERFGISGTTSVDKPLPTALALSSPWPNPASGQVRITLGLPAKSRAVVEVFDVRGRRVKTLLDAEREAGWHDLTWNGRDSGNGRVGAGLYFMRVRVGSRELLRRVTWLE